VDFVEPVVGAAAQHIGDGSEEEERNRVVGWLNRLIDENAWRRVFLWSAGLKLVQSKKVLSILKSQVYNKDKNTPGFDLGKAFKILLDPESKWDSAVRRLNRLDFVVRDLTFTGRIGITLDVDRLVAAANQSEDPDWKLIQSLDGYLTDTLFASAERQTESAIFQRSLVELLIDRKVSLGKLFGIDADDCYSDDDLKRIVQSRKQGKELFDATARRSWTTWTIRAATEEASPPSVLEKDLSGRRTSIGILSDPAKRRLIVHKMVQTNRIAVAMMHGGSLDRPSPADFLRTCQRVSHATRPRLIVSELHQVIGEGLCGRNIKHGLANGLADLVPISPSDETTLKGAANYLGRSAGSRDSSAHGIKLLIAGLEQPLASAGLDLPLKVMKAAVTGSEETRKTLGMDMEGAREVLWEHLLAWQDVYFSKRPVKAIVSVVKSVQASLLKHVLGDGSSKARDLELYTLLESLIQPYDRVQFRLSLPNFELINDNRQPENEYDVVTFVVRADKSVETWIWGVTTEENIATKRNSDMAKIQKMKDLLGNRWSGEIRTVQNYAHIENGEVCLEVDGRQEHRGLPKRPS